MLQQLNIDEETEESFLVGNHIWLWKEDLEEPIEKYIVGAELLVSIRGLVYKTLITNSLYFGITIRILNPQSI